MSKWFKKKIDKEKIDWKPLVSVLPCWGWFPAAAPAWVAAWRAPTGAWTARSPVGPTGASSGSSAASCRPATRSRRRRCPDSPSRTIPDAGPTSGACGSRGGSGVRKGWWRLTFDRKECVIYAMHKAYCITIAYAYVIQYTYSIQYTINDKVQCIFDIIRYKKYFLGVFVSLRNV